MRRFVAMAKNARIPIEEREQAVSAAGTLRDGPALRKLMALGNENTYLNCAAVAALGKAGSPEVAEYLKRKLSDPNPRLLSQGECPCDVRSPPCR